MKLKDSFLKLPFSPLGQLLLWFCFYQSTGCLLWASSCFHIKWPALFLRSSKLIQIGTVLRRHLCLSCTELPFFSSWKSNLPHHLNRVDLQWTLPKSLMVLFLKPRSFGINIELTKYNHAWHSNVLINDRPHV